MASIANRISRPCPVRSLSRASVSRSRVTTCPESAAHPPRSCWIRRPYSARHMGASRFVVRVPSAAVCVYAGLTQSASPARIGCTSRPSPSGVRLTRPASTRAQTAGPRRCATVSAPMMARERLGGPAIRTQHTGGPGTRAAIQLVTASTVSSRNPASTTTMPHFRSASGAASPAAAASTTRTALRAWFRAQTPTRTSTGPSESTVWRSPSFRRCAAPIGSVIRASFGYPVRLASRAR